MESVVGVLGADAEENRAFLSFSTALGEAGLPVPRVYAETEDQMAYLLSDLGDATLFETVARARAARPDDAFPGDALDLYRKVIRWLPRFQVEGGRVVDFSVAYPREAFDARSILWDLNYFKYLFLKLADIPFSEARLEDDFRTLASFLAGAPADYFLYRDFQSRNVMIVDGEPWFIDYQGGRRGALQYDVAALLYDAKAALPESVREDLLATYLDALGEVATVDRDEFVRFLRPFVLVRILQALGAYGLRGFYERKPGFLASVPYAAANLRLLLRDDPLEPAIPELRAVLRRIADDPRFGHRDAAPSTGLAVRVGSFSYKRGLPADDSGHGGGFVFDCRAIPNPGRQEAFAHLTGLDLPVRDFLEALPEAAAFWDSTRALVDAQIATYRERDFDSLTVHFGCTGGQHRSVHFAEVLGVHVRAAHPDVAVTVEHRERGSWPEAPAEPR
ncbi:MAG: RNase adapter RapZ [Gemmatimonadota bacterium]